MLYREILEVNTMKGIDRSDLTSKIREIIANCKIREGLCNIFLQANTAGLMINSNDLLLNQDFKKDFAEISDKKFYQHASDAFSHLRAAKLDTQQTIPISNGKPLLDDSQQIILWEFDLEPKKRRLIITISGE